jgi:hypothetical protein
VSIAASALAATASFAASPAGAGAQAAENKKFAASSIVSVCFMQVLPFFTSEMQVEPCAEHGDHAIFDASRVDGLLKELRSADRVGIVGI